MHPDRSQSSVALCLTRHKPLAACLAPLFSLVSATVIAAPVDVWNVNSCDEGSSGDLGSQTGTLRFAAANAASGATIDMTAVACSTISLTTGAIKLNQHDITIEGPSAVPLVIEGKLNTATGLFYHAGTGVLTVRNLEVSYSTNNDTASIGGGCIYSYGSIVLDHVRATHCKTKVRGGAVFALHDLTMNFSTIAFNEVRSASSARGGGAYARNHLVAQYSTIDHNIAYSSYCSGFSCFGGAGGGLFAKGLLLRNSTVSNNHSHGDGGGFAVVEGATGGDYLRMYSSTVSGNSADQRVGGGYASAPIVALYNSTIAFNSAATGNRVFAAGLALSTYFTPMSATLQSSLFSNNAVAQVTPVDNYGISEYDLGAAFGGTIAQPNLITFNAGPANNLVRSTFVTGLPSDTLHDSCPFLGPLRDNGGLTATHALLDGSSAIDKGNNVLDVLQDQRGLASDPGPPFTYARESGNADIGAYEVQKDDRIFATSGEACVVQPPGV